MIIAMVAVSVAVLACCVYLAVKRLRHQRTPSDLRGNWWADFERQFRAYDAEGRRKRRRERGDKPAKRPPAS
jgi:hypothetical protein